MLNRWNKLFAVAALAIALPVVANAQSSRVEGMALQGDYVKDWTGIFTYTSQVSHVGNLVYGEFGDGGFSDRGMGAVLGNLWEGRYGTWALHLRETTPALGQATTNSHPGFGAGGADLNENDDHSFDVMWGKRFGGTSLGIRLNRSFNESETSDPTTQSTVAGDIDERNIFGLGAGIGFEINPSSSFEGSVLWQSRTFEDTTNPIGGGTNMSEDSPTTFQLAARVMWQWQPNVMVVPVFKWWSYDHGFKSTTGAVTTTVEATQKGWQLGLAGNWTLNQNDLFVLGAALENNTIEQDADFFSFTPAPTDVPSKATEGLNPVLFAALETHVNPWLTIRFGANQAANRTIKFDPLAPGTTTDKFTDSDFNMALGIGVKVGGLQFDAIADDDFYHRFTQMSSDDAPAFAKVTATYPF
jgi:hypothetical protein